MPGRRKVLYLEVDIKRSREAQRAAWRRRKQKERASMSAAERARSKARDDKLCVTGARLEPHIDKAGPGGCWVWQGGYRAAWGGIRPVVRAGQYGRMDAAVAVWLWWMKKKELPRGARLARSCGNLQCVAPHHGLTTNDVVERAKKRRLGGENGDLQEGHPHQQGSVGG